MKYYSELTKELYDSQEELESAEYAILGDEYDPENTYSEETEETPTSEDILKELDVKIEEARNNYVLALKKVEVMSKAYIEEAESIIKEAKQQVIDAKKAKKDFIEKQEHENKLKEESKNKTAFELYDALKELDEFLYSFL